MIGANAMTSSPRGAVIRDVAKLVEMTLQRGMPDLDTVLGCCPARLAESNP
jgi:hypothetical protein